LAQVPAKLQSAVFRTTRLFANHASMMVRAILAHMFRQQSEKPCAKWQQFSTFSIETGSREPVPTVIPDALDDPGAFLPTDRCVAVSKRRLVACVVCALCLACVSTTPLLPWLRQKQTVEAKPDLVLLHDDKYAAWTTFRWAKHPTKCLDVAGENIGSQLQIWTCSDRFPKKQRFIVPQTNSAGEIRWATDPGLCLDNAGGNGITLQMWNCSMIPKKNRMFLISPDGKGHSRIRLAARPSKCVDIPMGKTDNGWKLQLWDCDDVSGKGREDNIAFSTITVVNCHWGGWSTWSACSVTCGGGSHIRSRKPNLKATHGGTGCKTGNEMEYGSCGSVQCKAGAASGAAASGAAVANGTSNSSSLAPTSSTSKTSNTSSQKSSGPRSSTSRARLCIVLFLASFPLAVDSLSIK